MLGSIERNCLNVEHWFGKGFIQTKRKRILSCIRKLSLKQRADAEMTSDDSTQSPIASRDDMEDFLNDCKTLDASQVSEMDCQEQSEMDCDDPEITHEFSRIQSQSHTEILSSDEEDMAAVLRSSPTRSIETDDEDGIHQIVVKKKVPVHRKLYPIFFESGSENDKF